MPTIEKMFLLTPFNLNSFEIGKLSRGLLSAYFWFSYFKKKVNFSKLQTI